MDEQRAKRNKLPEENMKLYHTGKTEIRDPDIHYGRKNADFGQGFYLTPDMEFANRWAGREAVLNEYELDEKGLVVHRFERSEEWFRYISEAVLSGFISVCAGFGKTCRHSYP